MYFVSCRLMAANMGNDPGAKVSFFMHDWRQLVMFQEQMWLLTYTLKNELHTTKAIELYLKKLHKNGSV